MIEENIVSSSKKFIYCIVMDLVIYTPGSDNDHIIPKEKKKKSHFRISLVGFLFPIHRLQCFPIIQLFNSSPGLLNQIQSRWNHLLSHRNEQRTCKPASGTLNKHKSSAGRSKHRHDCVCCHLLNIYRVYPPAPFTIAEAY